MSESSFLGKETLLQWSTGEGAARAVAFLLAALSCFYLVRYMTCPRPKLPYPPGPPGHWLMGNILEMPNLQKGEFLSEKFLEWSKEYGPVFSIRLPFVVGRIIVVADPDVAKYIMITKNYPKSWTYSKFTPIIGERSIVIAEGEEWFALRRAFNPGFSPNFLKKMVSVMAEKMQRFTKCIDCDIANGNDTNMLERSQTFTSDVIVQIGFGEDWGGDKPHPAREWETEITELLADITYSWLHHRRVKKVQALLDAEMFDIIDRRLQQSSEQQEDRTDICSIAIDQLRQPDGTLAEDDKITVMHQLKTFYFAGHDTTATTIAWCIWLLSQHNLVLDKVRSELAEHGVNALTPTFEQLQKCTYLEAVIKETLRLYPPVIIGRYTPNVNESFGPFTLGGAVLLFDAYVMHRQESVWGENANEFCPERFFEDPNVSHKFLSFSRGPRDCLGKYFAMLEAKIAVSAIVTQYEMKCVDPNDHPCSKVTLCPFRGAKVQFTR